MSDFIVERQPMICGSAEAERLIYRKVQASNGYTYYVPINSPEPGAQIQVDTHDPNSDGYGGRALTFALEDGTKDRVKGPWHTNSDDLYADTGIDLRNQHLTFVVVARDRYSDEDYRTVLGDVLYQDEQPVLGAFDRYKEILARFPDEPTLFYYSQSRGGSVCGAERMSQAYKDGWKQRIDEMEAKRKARNAAQALAKTLEARPSAIKAAKCVPAPIGCGQPITGWRDSLSAQEYIISGLCQNCQDSVFGDDDSNDSEDY